MTNHLLQNSLKYHRMESLGDESIEKILIRVIEILNKKNEDSDIFTSKYDKPVVEIEVGSQVALIGAKPPVLIGSGTTVEDVRTLVTEVVATKLADFAFAYLQALKDQQQGKPVELYTINMVDNYRNPAQPMVPSVMLSIRVF